MSVNAANIPQELKDLSQWCVWRTTVRDGSETKVPFQPNGDFAKSNDPETWSTFSEAMDAYCQGNWDGIGFMFSANDPYTGIDLDGCRNPDTGEWADWARSLIVELASYAEVSPSQTGVKIWVRGAWPYSGGHKVVIEDAPRMVDKTPAIEIYDSVRYFTVTGNRVRGQSQIADRSELLGVLRERFWKAAPTFTGHGEFRSATAVYERARRYLAKIPPAVSGQDGHGTTFKVACAMVLGFELSTEEAMSLLGEWNQGCSPPWSERELRHKVDDAARQNGERGYLRNVSPNNYDRIDIPNYVEPAAKPKVIREAKPERDAEGLAPITVTLLDDAARKYHAAVTSGKVNLFQLGLPELDYSIGGGVEAGEMIIFAGRPSHGKSMAAQQAVSNFCANGIPSMFVSEEMSNLAIGKRAIQYATAVPNENWTSDASKVTGDIDDHFRDRAPCYILEGCRSADRVAIEIARFVKEKKVGLAVVDYAQLLAGRGKGRYEEITNVSIQLKKVLGDCGIPGIVLCQMSRSIESRGSFVPVMSDLKESGQFEQDADVIVFQVWPHKIDHTLPPEEYMFFVAKNRNRPTLKPVVKCNIVPSRQMLVYEGAGIETAPSFGRNSVPDVFGDGGLQDFI